MISLTATGNVTTSPTNLGAKFLVTEWIPFLILTAGSHPHIIQWLTREEGIWGTPFPLINHLPKASFSGTCITNKQ